MNMYDNEGLFLDAIVQVIIDSKPEDVENDYYGNLSIFVFIQRLKGIDPDMAQNRSTAKMKEIVKTWWESYRQDITGKGGYSEDDHCREEYPLSFTETWAVFLETWPKVMYGKGASLARAKERARRRKKPLVEAKKFNDDKSVQYLIAVCHELQKIQGNKPFWISCYAAGEILGRSHGTGNQILKMLVTEGVLKLEKKHTTNRATRYRYIEHPL